MHVLRISCTSEDKDRIVAELWERGTTGLIEEEDPGGAWRLSAFFETRLDLPGDWEAVDECDWVAVSQAQWEPLLIGARFFLTPPWRADPTPPGRVRLEMLPGSACGTGWHPATQLALEAMERGLRPGAAVLDVGTGSGILARAARLLGAAAVYGCDIDADAVAAAREAGIPAALFVGSVRSVRTGAVDLVVANINAETLAGLAPDLRRVRAPGGRIVASGFPDRHAARVREAFGGGGELLARDGWSALLW